MGLLGCLAEEIEGVHADLLWGAGVVEGGELGHAGLAVEEKRAVEAGVVHIAGLRVVFEQFVVGD